MVTNEDIVINVQDIMTKDMLRVSSGKRLGEVHKTIDQSVLATKF
jgi:hypothetical protein